MHNSVHARSEEDFAKLKAALLSGLSDFESELVSRKTDFFGGPNHPGMLDYVVWPWFERMGAFPLVDDLSEFPALVRLLS